MSNIGSKYRYQMGGFNWATPQQGQNAQQGAGVLGSFVTELDGPKPSVGGGVASGALTGASMGAALGPIGMAGGAIIGGVIGGIGASRKQKEQEEAQRKALKAQNAQFRNYSQTVLQSYPTQGVDTGGYYMKYGGQLPSFLTNALAEGGEVAVSKSVPLTDENGAMEPIASDVSKFHGDSHENQSGGIGFKSNSDTYIFSDSLRTPDGVTYAKQAEIFGKEKGKFEKKLQNASDHAAMNTANRMIEKINKRIDLLFQHQENSKL